MIFSFILQKKIAFYLNDLNDKHTRVIQTNLENGIAKVIETPVSDETAAQTACDGCLALCITLSE